MKKGLVVALLLVIGLASPALAADGYLQFLTKSARTVTGTSDVKQVGDYTEMSMFVDSAACTGTTPTLDITLQDSPDGTVWHTLDTYTQITTSVSLQVKRKTEFGRYARLSYVITGTTPSCEFGVEAILKQK